jgi:hypothetical protein
MSRAIRSCITLIASALTMLPTQARAQECPPFESMELLEPLPEPVTNNAVCSGYSNGKPFIYSFGGIDTSKSHDGIHLKSWRYNIEDGVWESLPDLPDTLGKIASGASYMNGIIYIVGGYHVLANGSEISSRLVHRFDCETSQYLSNASDLPVAIDDHVQSVWRDSLLIALTGWSNNNNVAWLQAYNPKNDTWISSLQLWDFPKFNSFGASGTIVGDTLYYFGGAASTAGFPIQPYLREGIINPNDVSNISWSLASVDAQHALYRSTAINIDGVPTWIGGGANTYNYDGIAYDGTGGVEPSSNLIQWEDDSMFVNNCIGAPVDLRGSAWFPERGELYIVGGMGAAQQVSPGLIRFNISTLALPELRGTDITIFPNPARDRIWVEAETTVRVEVYGVDGGLYRTETILGKQEIEIRPGINLLRVHQESNVTQRIVIGQ